jgi:hypothetical protein
LVCPDTSGGIDAAPVARQLGPALRDARETGDCAGGDDAAERHHAGRHASAVSGANGAGGMQLEWHTRGIDLEIEFTSPNHVLGLFEDQREGVCWEKDMASNIAPLHDVIASLSRQ